MIPSKGWSYTVRTEDGEIREMTQEEVMTKLVRKSKKRASRNSAGGEVNRHGSPQRYSHGEVVNRHGSPQRYSQVPSRVTVPMSSPIRGGGRRNAPAPVRGDNNDQAGLSSRKLSTEKGKRDPSVGEERRDPPASREECDDDLRSTSSRQRGAWPRDCSVERNTMSPEHVVDETMYSNTSPRAKLHPSDYHHSSFGLSSTNSFGQFTVNTEKEGQKIMSQAEINRLIRSSIVKARKQAATLVPQPPAKVYKLVPELSSPAGKKSQKSPQNQAKQMGPPTYLWTPILPEANAETMASPSFAECTEPSQLTDPSTLIAFNINDHSRRIGSEVSVPRTELYEEIHGKRQKGLTSFSRTELYEEINDKRRQNYRVSAPRTDRESNQKGQQKDMVSVPRNELYEEINDKRQQKDMVSSPRTEQYKESNQNVQQKDMASVPRAELYEQMSDEGQQKEMITTENNFVRMSPQIPIVQGEVVGEIVVEEIPDAIVSVHDVISPKSNSTGDAGMKAFSQELSPRSKEQLSPRSKERSPRSKCISSEESFPEILSPQSEVLPEEKSMQQENTEVENNEVEATATFEHDTVVDNFEAVETASFRQGTVRDDAIEVEGTMSTLQGYDDISEACSSKKQVKQDASGLDLVSTASDSKLEPEEAASVQLEEDAQTQKTPVINMSDNQIVDLVHQSMDKAQRSARREVQEILQFSKRKKNTIEVKTAEGKKVMTQQEIADLVKESMRRARESAQEEIAMLVKDSVRLARESAQEEIKAMVEESMLRARESAQREMAEMIRESLQRARYSDASLMGSSSIGNTTTGVSLFSPSEFVFNVIGREDDMALSEEIPAQSSSQSFATTPNVPTPIIQADISHNEHLKDASEERPRRSSQPGKNGRGDQLKALPEESTLLSTAPSESDQACARGSNAEDNMLEDEDKLASKQTDTSQIGIAHTSSPDIFFGIEQEHSDPIERSREVKKKAGRRKDTSVKQQNSIVAGCLEEQDESGSEQEGERFEVVVADTSSQVGSPVFTESVVFATSACDASYQVADREESSYVTNISESVFLVSEDGRHQVKSPSEEEFPHQQDSMKEKHASSSPRPQSRQTEGSLYEKMKNYEAAKKMRINKAARALLKPPQDSDLKKSPASKDSEHPSSLRGRRKERLPRAEYNRHDSTSVKERPRKKPTKPRQRKRRQNKKRALDIGLVDIQPSNRDNLAPMSPSAFSARTFLSTRDDACNSKSSTSRSAKQDTVSYAMDGSIGAETVVTDQFLAQIAARKGRNTTTNDLTRMMETSISNRVDWVLSPDLEKKGKDQETLENAKKGGEAETRDKDIEKNDSGKISPAASIDVHNGGFCLNIMELLTINEELGDKTDADTTEGGSRTGTEGSQTVAHKKPSVFSPASTWIDSLAEEMSSALENNDSLDLYSEADTTDHGDATTFDIGDDDSSSTDNDDSRRDSYYRQDATTVGTDGNSEDMSIDDNSFNAGWWEGKRKKWGMREQPQPYQRKKP